MSSMTMIQSKILVNVETDDAYYFMLLSYTLHSNISSADDIRNERNEASEMSYSNSEDCVVSWHKKSSPTKLQVVYTV